MTVQIKEPGSEPEAKSGYHSLFRNRQFMSLWIAQIFSQFSDRAVFVLFVAVLTSHPAVQSAVGGASSDLQTLTKVGGVSFGAAQMTSLLYVAFTIPAVVLSPLAGVYVDRWSHRMVLICSNLARAACVAVVALPSLKEHPVAALSLAFMLSIGSQFFGPAETASIPRIVKQEDLYSANSLFFTTMMIALGFGFAIGEPIISATGIGGAPYAVATGFLIAALLLIGIEDNKRVASKSTPWWEELRTGIAYIVNNSTVFRAILKITVLFSTIITLNIIAVGLAEQVMHLQPFQFGYLVAAAGLGMGIGNFWVGHHGKNVESNRLVYSGFSGLGLFMTLLGSLGFVREYLFPSLGLVDVYFNGWLMLIPLFFSLCIGVSCAFVAVPLKRTQSAYRKSFARKSVRRPKHGQCPQPQRYRCF